MSEMNFLSLLCLTLVLVWILQILWKRRKLYIYSWSIPGPPSFPLIGSAYLFLGKDILEVLLKVQKQYCQGLGKIWFGPKLVYFMTQPEHVGKVLTKALNKDELYEFISFIAGHGLMTAELEKWKRHRKSIMPAFNQKILDNFVDVFAQQSEILADQLQNYSGQKNKNFDLFLVLSRCTLDIVCETAMGIQLHIQTSDSNFGRNLERIMEITTYRIFRIWHHLTFTWRFYPISKEYSTVLDRFHNLISSVVRKKIEDYEAKKRLEKDSITVDSDEDPRTRKVAFLDLILKNSEFTEEDLREELNIFMIAGSDTTASTMTCLFMLLGMFQDIQIRVGSSTTPDIQSGPLKAKQRLCTLAEPNYIKTLEHVEYIFQGDIVGAEIHPIYIPSLGAVTATPEFSNGNILQQKVLEEILDIMGPDRTVLPTDLPGMKYAERVIKEAMRIFPVAAFFVRYIKEDIDLGDAILPADSSAFFCPVQIQRNPKYWPDPLKFDPDRFLPGKGEGRHPCTSIPFSYGPRNCIGARYAMMNMKTILATVIRKYKIFSEYKNIEEIQLQIKIVLKLKDGPKVWMEPR